MNGNRTLIIKIKNFGFPEQRMNKKGHTVKEAKV